VSRPRRCITVDQSADAASRRPHGRALLASGHRALLGHALNTSAFVVPPQYTFGDAGRNSVRGPGFASFDLAVSKQLQVSGHTKVTAGLQVFNVFNHTNFNLPEHLVDEPSTFGQIFSAKAPRQLQLSVRLAF
jgi:hypothetical protein